MDVVHAAEDSCGQLGAEGVPDAVLDFGCCGGCITVGDCGGWGVDGDALLAVDGFAWGQVLGDEEVFFAAGYEDAGVAVGFL